MRLLRLSASLALLSVTTARLIMVNFPPGTTDELYQATKSAFREAGGEISHEFNIIRAFSADASNDAINALKSWTMTNEVARDVVVEDDQIVSVPKNGPQ